MSQVTACQKVTSAEEFNNQVNGMTHSMDGQLYVSFPNEPVNKVGMLAEINAILGLNNMAKLSAAVADCQKCLPSK